MEYILFCTEIFPSKSLKFDKAITFHFLSPTLITQKFQHNTLDAILIMLCDQFFFFFEKLDQTSEGVAAILAHKCLQRSRFEKVDTRNIDLPLSLHVQVC